MFSGQLVGSGSDGADESEHGEENGEFHDESSLGLCFLLERSIRKWSLGVEVTWWDASCLLLYCEVHSFPERSQLALRPLGERRTPITDRS
jgi:hypothetical protein